MHIDDDTVFGTYHRWENAITQARKAARTYHCRFTVRATPDGWSITPNVKEYQP